MNAELLLREFDRTADAPDAVARIRRFVLALAVRGRLSDQTVSDEPASHLVDALRTARTRMRASRHELPPLTEGDKPFALPASWEWIRLGDVCDYDAGDKRNAAQLNPDSWLLELEDIERDTSMIRAFYRVKDRSPQSTKSAFNSGDVLYGKLRPYLNKVVVAPDAGYSTTEIVAIRPFVPMCSEYICLALRRPDFVDYVTQLGRGTKMPRLRTQDALSAPFPLPPIAEQYRIVAKVDVLMTLCDQLESTQREREIRRERFRATTLQRLTRSDGDGGTRASDVRMFFNRSPQLITTPDHVAAVRQAILDLAVRGRLVPQRPTDEPAAQLLARIEKQKRASGLAVTGRDWVSKIGASGADDFAVPRGWEWSRIGTAVERVTVGYVGPMTSHYVESGIPFLRSQNVRPNRFRPDGLIAISREFHNRIRKSALTPGDVVVVRSGNVGTACVVPGILPEANCSDLVVVKKPMALVSEFLSFYLNSLASAHVQAGTVGMALVHFNTRSVATMPIPVPPLAEQHRIVAKVDQLMAMCDELEAALSSAQGGRGRLLEALLHDVLEGAEVPDLMRAVKVG